MTAHERPQMMLTTTRRLTGPQREQIRKAWEHLTRRPYEGRLQRRAREQKERLKCS